MASRDGESQLAWMTLVSTSRFGRELKNKRKRVKAAQEHESNRSSICASARVLCCETLKVKNLVTRLSSGARADEFKHVHCS